MQSVCTEVLFVLDSKKTQVENVFPIEISDFLQQQFSDTGRSIRQMVGYGSQKTQVENVFPIEISDFLQQQFSDTDRSMRQMVGYGSQTFPRSLLSVQPGSN